MQGLAATIICELGPSSVGTPRMAPYTPARAALLVVLLVIPSSVITPAGGARTPPPGLRPAANRTAARRGGDPAATATEQQHPRPGLRRPRVVGWYEPPFTKSTNNATDWLLDGFPWHVYTHVRVFHTDTIHLSRSGHARCGPQHPTQYRRFLAHARKQGVKVLGGSPNGFAVRAVFDALFDLGNRTFWDGYRAAVLATLGDAVRECGLDGLEFDYEWADDSLGKYGLIDPEKATAFTRLMAEIKTALGPNRTVSCDVDVWGYHHAYYAFQLWPNADAAMVNAGALDWVNTMSYHWTRDGDLGPWEKDAFVMHGVWGFDKERVNIGVPWYATKGDPAKNQGGPSWRLLSRGCPNVAPDVNTCGDYVFIGKRMNERLGRFIGENGWGGVFPWAGTYDDIATAENATARNNSLTPWLAAGLASGVRAAAAGV